MESRNIMTRWWPKASCASRSNRLAGSGWSIQTGLMNASIRLAGIVSDERCSATLAKFSLATESAVKTGKRYADVAAAIEELLMLKVGKLLSEYAILRRAADGERAEALEDVMMKTLTVLTERLGALKNARTRDDIAGVADETIFIETRRTMQNAMA